MENKKLTTEEMASFRTTTGRVVGILLDLERKTLQFWLNGKEQLARNKAVTEGYWLPAIRISGIENCVILNPFAQNPSCGIPYTCCNAPIPLKNDVENYLDSWVFLPSLKADIPSMPKIQYVTSQVTTNVGISEVIMPLNESGKTLGCALVKVNDVQQFVKDCGTTSTIVPNFPPIEAAKLLLAAEKTPQTELLIRCIKEREEQVRGLIKDVIAGFNEGNKVNDAIISQQSEYMKSIKDDSKVYTEDISLCQYLPYTDKLLLLGKSLLKLVDREGVENMGFGTQPGSLAGMRLELAPKNIKDYIKLHINRKEAQFLANKLNWTAILDANTASIAEDLLTFLRSLFTSFAVDTSPEIFIELPYVSAKKSIEAIMRSILQALASAETELPIKENILKTLVYQRGVLVTKEQKPETQQDHLSLEELNFLMNIILTAEEQLWCMASTDDVGEDVRALWDMRTSRVHTTYGRLASFVSWPTHGAIALAEAGLMCVGDKKLTLRHFMEPASQIENVLCYDEKTRNEVWTILEKQFPNNRMLRGEPCFNVPLNVTMRYFPPLQHTNYELEPQEITNVESKPNSHLVMTGSSDGSVCIWNTRLRLFKAAFTNFKVNLEVKLKPIPPGEAVKNVVEQPQALSKLFDEEAPAEPSAEIELPPEVEPKPEEKKKEEVKKIVTPKPELVTQMMNMGFSEDIAKKALVATNNESIEVAMDAALELQKKAPAIVPRVEEKKQEGEWILQSWACPKCTLINKEGVKVCDVCGELAPQTAYKPVKKEEKKEPVLNVEAEKLKEQKLKEEQLAKELEEKRKIEEEKRKAEEEEKRKIEEEKKLIASSKVCGYSMLIHNEYPETPFTLMCLLANSAGTMLRLRRFKYSARYLNRFLSHNQNGKDIEKKGKVSQISDLWLSNTDEMEAKQYLFSECRDVIETLSPIFVRNQLKDGWNLEKTKLADVCIVLRDELDVQLPCAKVFGVCSATIEGGNGDNHFAFVLGKKVENGPLLLLKLQISSAIGDDSKLTAKIVSEIQLTFEDNAKILCDNEKYVVVVSKEKTTIINIEKFEVFQTINEYCELQNVHIIEENSGKITQKEIDRISHSTTMQIYSQNEKQPRYCIAYIKEDGIRRYWLESQPKEESKSQVGIDSSKMQELQGDFPEIVYSYSFNSLNRMQKILVLRIC